MRLIAGDALQERVDNLDGKLYSPILFEEMVKNTPTIEAEPVKHGTWERIDGKIHGYVCNICEYGICTGKMPYCPQCGARMDGDNDD